MDIMPRRLPRRQDSPSGKVNLAEGGLSVDPGRVAPDRRSGFRPMPTKKKTPSIHPDLESVLFTEDKIKRRVKSLARELKSAYGESEFTIISIINGAVLFTADLMREIDNPVRLDCVRISSYGDKTRSSGTPQIVHSLTLDIAKRHVLLIDDILDTGKTIALVDGLVRKLQPASLRVCVLLDKQGRREVPFEADFVGFRIPDKFVVGYGLDFAERYRNLPCIGVLRPELQNPPEWA
jgi:hypoxanthine phosphoribosyltransferase